MADFDGRNAELIDDDPEFQIIDLDPPDAPQKKQAALARKIIRASLLNPWVSYGLPAALLLILLGTLILQWPRPAPASTPYRPPATVLAMAFAGNLVFIQDTYFTLTAFQLATGHPRWHVQLPSTVWMQAGDQTHLYCLFASSASHNSSELEALDIQTGKVLWHDILPIVQSTPLSDPVEDPLLSHQTGYILSGAQRAPYFLYQNHIIYLHTIDDAIYAIQASNGQTRWTYQAKAQNPPPQPGSRVLIAPWLVVQNGVVEFQADNASIYLLDASSGQEIRAFPPDSDGNSVYPFVDGQIALILPLGPSPIRAFHLPDGQPLWTYPLPQGSWTMPGDNGMVYLGATRSSTLTALRISDRQKIWSYHASDNQPVSYPYWNLTSSIIYLLQQDSTLVSLRASDGQVLWRTRIADLARVASQSPRIMLQGNTIVLFDPANIAQYAVSTTPMYVLNASTGRLLWQSATPSGPFMLLADTLYTIQPSGQIDAWRNSDGEHLWSYRAPAGSRLYSSPGLSPAQLFYLDLAGKLFVLRTSDSKLLWHNP